MAAVERRDRRHHRQHVLPLWLVALLAVGLLLAGLSQFVLVEKVASHNRRDERVQVRLENEIQRLTSEVDRLQTGR